MDIIDCHVHVTTSGQWFDTSYNASISRLEKEMDYAGITKAVLIPFSHMPTDDLHYCLELAKKKPNIFAVAPQVDITTLPLLTGYESIVVGLKVHPRMQQVDPTSPVVQDVLNIAYEMGKPVIFDAYMQSSSIPMRLLDPYVFDEIAKKNREMTFVLAHSCWPRLLDAYTVAKANPNVYLDLSYFGKIAKDTYLLHDFCHLLEKLDQKVIFGTDFPEVEMTEYTSIWQKNLKHLSKKKQENIFYRNAQTVFNL